MIIGRNISKMFRIPGERRNTLFEEVVAFVKGKRRYDEFWALKNVSFEVKEGEIFGITGPNGSGKTTLLGIIADIIYPDEGGLIVNGRITPILALGVGFNPELTAREDEVLAVGDIEFQRKCMDEINNINKNGTTIVFVSHSVEAVRDLCARAMFLDNGEVIAMGAAEEVVNAYLNSVA